MAKESLVAEDNEITLEHSDDPRPLVSQLVADLVLIAASIAGWMDLAGNEYIDFGQNEFDPGPGFIPRASLIMLGGGALLHLITLIVQAWQVRGFRSDGSFSADRIIIPALLTASMIAYYVFFPVLGFLLSSILLGAFWVPMFHWRSGAAIHRRHYAFFAIEALLISYCTYALFRYLIQVPLP